MDHSIIKKNKVKKEKDMLHRKKDREGVSERNEINAERERERERERENCTFLNNKLFAIALK